MKIVHIRKLVSLEHPTCKLLKEFLSRPEIKKLKDEEEVSYTQWKCFIALNCEASSFERESDFWGENELLRNFFRVWVLQETKLPYLLNYQKLRFQTEQAVLTHNVRALELLEAKDDVFAALYVLKQQKLMQLELLPIFGLHTK